MLQNLLSHIFVNQWAIFAFVTIVLIITADLGYRFGVSSKKKNPDQVKNYSAFQGAILGLLGLLLGFSFAMAVGRYETRFTLVVEEANSIGTTWLRADFLPEQHKLEVKKLLLRYTELRVKSKGMRDKSKVSELVKESDDLQQSLWAQAVAAAKESPGPIIMGFITSLNQTIDLQSSRLAARDHHVPGGVWLLLLIVAGCGCWIGSFGGGKGGHRSSFNQIMFPLLIAIVITLISDIDQSQKGLIHVSQKPIEDLYKSMTK